MVAIWRKRARERESESEREREREKSLSHKTSHPFQAGQSTYFQCYLAEGEEKKPVMSVKTSERRRERCPVVKDE